MGDSASSWTTIAMILFVIIGCILTVFLGYLVRSAYDMRIGLKAQLDRGLHAVDEESAKKARGLRQELGAEIEHARAAIFEEARRRLGDAATTMEARQAEYEKAARQDRMETAVMLDTLRDDIAALRARIDDLERELLIGGAEDEPPVTPVTPSASSVTPAIGGAATTRLTPSSAAPIGVAVSRTTATSLRFSDPRAVTKVAAG